METVIVIPSRFAAVRLPGKPLLELNGRPLLGHVIDRCRAAFGTRLSIIVATDDDRIASFAHKQNVESIMTPASCPNGTMRVYLALKERMKKIPENLRILHVQGDEPMITPKMLQALSDLIQKPDATVATLAAPLPDPDLQRDPNIVKVTFRKDGRALYFSRSLIPAQGFPMTPNSTVYGHIGLYAWTGASLEKYVSLEPTALERAECLEQLRWLENGGEIRLSVVSDMPLGVNTPEDLARVSRLLVEQ